MNIFVIIDWKFVPFNMDSKKDIYNLWIQYTTKVIFLLLFLLPDSMCHCFLNGTWMQISCFCACSNKNGYNSFAFFSQNEENYFRQFIQGFVSIWQNQLLLDFKNAPHWSSIAPDSGPHLNRLPEELLPAIEKFLIIARDKFEKVGQLFFVIIILCSSSADRLRNVKGSPLHDVQNTVCVPS